MSDEPNDDLRAVRTAAERFATAQPDAPDRARPALERALPPVLGTLLGGALLVLLGGLTGAVSLGAAPLLAAVVLALAAGAGSWLLAARQARREAAVEDTRRIVRSAEHHARQELVAAIGGTLAHVERLDAERATLHRTIERLDRRLTVKERKLAKLQAFDAERRTLEPAPSDEPLDGQLTFDAVAD